MLLIEGGSDRLTRIGGGKAATGTGSGAALPASGSGVAGLAARGVLSHADE